MKHAKEMHEKAMAIKAERESARREMLASLFDTDLMERIEDSTNNGLFHVKYELRILPQETEWVKEYLGSFGYSTTFEYSKGDVRSMHVMWDESSHENTLIN